jgi:hypothetical protein
MNAKTLRIMPCLVLLACCLGTPAVSGFYDPSIQRWVNRDPIGEKGGFNLYGFSGNVPTLKIDRDGRSPIHLGGAVALRCGVPYLAAAHWKFNDDQDKLKHCWVSCMIARDCGMTLSVLAGLVKEEKDLLFWGGLDATIEDMEANIAGYGCAGAETVIQGFGWCTRWFRKSCEDCCRSKGY